VRHFAASRTSPPGTLTDLLERSSHDGRRALTADRHGQHRRGTSTYLHQAATRVKASRINRDEPVPAHTEPEAPPWLSDEQREAWAPAVATK
jgi:hypothetical protein